VVLIVSTLLGELIKKGGKLNYWFELFIYLKESQALKIGSLKLASRGHSNSFSIEVL